MYRKFFGLTSLPFKTTPELQMFYRDGSREQILEALLYTVTRGDGILKVTGEVGSGKTMLLRLLASRLPEDTEIIYINSPNLSAKDILLYICNELNIDTSKFNEKFSLTNALKERLVDLHASGKRVVMLIDEAQAMTFDALEEIRLLSNIETSDDKLLQMVLFGQPELDVAMENEKVRQIKSRISYSIYVPALSVKEVHAYLNYRMRQAGYTGLDVFNLKMAKRIQKLSMGLPRNINVIADKILMACFGSGDTVAKNKHFKSLTELEQDSKPKFRNVYVLLSLSLILFFTFLFVKDNTFFHNLLLSIDNDQIVNQVDNDQTEVSDTNSTTQLTSLKTFEMDLDTESTPAAPNVSGNETLDSSVATIDLVDQAESDLNFDSKSSGISNENIPNSVNRLAAPTPITNAIQNQNETDNAKILLKINKDMLEEPFRSLYERGRLIDLLTEHVNTKKWLLNEQKRYVIQLSTRHVSSLGATLKFYRNYKIDTDSLKILIDFNKKAGVYRLKVFYYPSDSFAELNSTIDYLPEKIRRDGPYIVKKSSLEQKLQQTETKFKEVGIINE